MPESESQPKLRSKEGVRAFLVVLLVAAVGVATIGLPAVYGGATTTATAAEPSPNVESYESVSQAESSLGPADDVYLRDDGSAVLQYEDDTDVDKLDIGADVSKGLVHMLVVDNVSEQDAEYEEASFSAVLDQSGLSGDGSLVMEQPDSLKDLSVDVSGEVSEEANQFDATASGTFESQAAAMTASSDGTVTATAERLETSGSVSVDGGMAAGTGGNMQMDVSLEDTQSGYVLDVSQNQPVSDWSASKWETREQAKRTLQQQYGNLATGLGGSSEITISNYNFEERSTGQHRLEIDFTVTYSGIDSGIERQLATQLASDPTTGLSQSEASEIASSVTELEIETLEFAVDSSSGSMEATWDVAIANYDELTLAMVDLAEASSTTSGVAQEDLENARAAIEAQQAANLESTLQWDVSIEQTSDQEMTLDAEVTGDTTNWGSYIDELESRDVEPPKDVTFSMTAETNDGELELDAKFELEAEDLASQAVKSWAQSMQGSPTGTTMSSDANQFITALSESELEVARVDANLGDGTVRVEGGAKFENMSKITNTISDTVAISGVSSEMNDGTASMYVYVDSMGDVDTASATKADIEHLGVVGAETTVHAAGEWDREFPSVDTEAMNNYLEGGSEEKDDEGGDSIPGFGFGASITAVAALLTALVLRRQE
ncbi:hypothetical protein [Natrinema sp. 1APR25-10V2]|uniref:hypothetical protein n=1 Tax=Natrinema sp. 1APR25-10V2 TaxID=2951081 RepID=UPI0028758306|nr:hypothetical protein [Natrinema sp. 1APR25-10V2]MDS0473846.1 hypothetical protein [Natrinema sp. 1APR25-10V2]